MLVASFATGALKKRSRQHANTHLCVLDHEYIHIVTVDAASSNHPHTRKHTLTHSSLTHTQTYTHAQHLYGAKTSHAIAYAAAG